MVQAPRRQPFDRIPRLSPTTETGFVRYFPELCRKPLKTLETRVDKGAFSGAERMLNGAERVLNDAERVLNDVRMSARRDLL